MWKLSDLKANERYFLRLCETDEGVRFFLLLPIRDRQAERSAFETEDIPNDLLQRRDLAAIARTVRLRNGGRFIVDAHNVWLMEEEVRALKAGNEDLGKVPWVNGRVPQFSPK